MFSKILSKVFSRAFLRPRRAFIPAQHSTTNSLRMLKWTPYRNRVTASRTSIGNAQRRIGHRIVKMANDVDTTKDLVRRIRWYALFCTVEVMNGSTITRIIDYYTVGKLTKLYERWFGTSQVDD
ncbi:hypothetical protein W97_04687 [Coniosporium apollinis CBS 100218]|uniref:Uncharacterized protein n=1 Tax=Coniosporium apollinis (strain CBS 100218) TaxID=1168221 RepID=R7YUG3_CONA1|nr:uncharacterized protein W97_04687 [Coniosporium apollinis CBS 100218]EON65449.1 hypothetical protein W97_04687 [Coniosporium apollinis CBS 100218]